jgi:multicomponent Na+:H+ antiporter subunit F
MTGFLLVAALYICALLVIGLHRVWQGPTVFDRLVAVALVTANTLVILLVVASYLDRIEVFTDIAIAYALLAFALPLALGKHYETGFGRTEEEER